jgi:hypothetical protein
VPGKLGELRQAGVEPSVQDGEIDLEVAVNENCSGERAHSSSASVSWSLR